MKRLNALQPVRPMVLIDEIPWHEMDVDGFLKSDAKTLSSAGSRAVSRTLYRWDHLRCDMVVSLTLKSRARSTAPDSASKKARTPRSRPNNWIVGHHYKPQIETEEDLEKWSSGSLRDKVKNEQRSQAREALGGIWTSHDRYYVYAPSGTPCRMDHTGRSPDRSRGASGVLEARWTDTSQCLRG